MHARLGSFLVPCRDANISFFPRPQLFLDMASRPKIAAFLISNCDASSDRLDYIQELRKHMRVDGFGRCGEKPCFDEGKQQSCSMSLLL